MNYELAKQLKEKGFPLKRIEECRYSVRSIERGIDGIYDYIEYPTLSELIEACGGYIRLWSDKSGWYVTKHNGKKELQELLVIFGFTHEEAVAKLWLKLHEN